MAVDSEHSEGQHSTSDAGGGGAQSTENASQGGDLDFQQFLTSHRQEMDEVKGHLKQKDTELQRTGETIKRMRSALSDEPENTRGAAKDPYDEMIADANAQLDRVIEIAMEAERKGNPIPLTANLGVQLQKTRIDSYERERKLTAQIAEMKEVVDRLKDPGNRIEEQAFNNMDSHLESAIDNIFGPNDGHSKDAMFTAVTQRVVREIRDLKKTDPDTWNRIRRDQGAQKKLVNHFVKEMIPPRARQIMEQDEIRRTPMGTNEKLSAFREAKELLKQQPQNYKLKEHIEELRQELVAETYGKSFSGGSSQRRMQGE